jgi:large subunit ribosomal protein L35
MPKFKPRKSVKKRFRLTATGKVVCRGSGSVHRRVLKSAKRKRRLMRTKPLHAHAARAVKTMLGMHN